MTRHAGSAQLGQRSALPCCFGLVLICTYTHTHTHAWVHKLACTSSHHHPPLTPARSLVSYLDTHSLTGKHTQAHTQNATILANVGPDGEGLD